MFGQNNLTKQCSKCLEWKPATKEYFHIRTGSEQLRRQCIVCQHKSQAKWRAANPEKRKEDARAWNIKNKGRRKEENKAYREANREKIRETVRLRREQLSNEGKEIRRAKIREWNHKNRIRLREKAKNIRIMQRRECLEHYGGKCACCGEMRYEFLSIDHVNGGGNKHRKELALSAGTTVSGIHMVLWLKKNGYPEGFRVLCHNCNQAIGYYGACPHERERESQPEWIKEFVKRDYSKAQWIINHDVDLSQFIKPVGYEQ